MAASSPLPCLRCSSCEITPSAGTIIVLGSPAMYSKAARTQAGRPEALRARWATAPSVFANAMMAPPWSTAGRVHGSSQTICSAVTRLGSALVKVIPRSLAKGSILPLRSASRSMCPALRAEDADLDFRSGALAPDAHLHRAQPLELRTCAVAGREREHAGDRAG